MSNNLLSLNNLNPDDKNACHTDEFSKFFEIAQNSSKSSSNNVSPVKYARPRSKSMFYENNQNFLLPDASVNVIRKRSPSPSRKSLGNIPVIKTMLKVDNYYNSGMGKNRRPSLCPMKNCNQDDDIFTFSDNLHNLDEMCHVRSFKVTDKKLINEGDILINKNIGNIKANNTGKQQTYVPDLGTETPINIQILGATGVGKTTLASQFMTSEQICCRMMSVNEETEKLFSVQIDNREWNILLHDTRNLSMDTVNEVRVELLDKMNAYIVLFAIDDLSSFEYSKQVLNDIFKYVDLPGCVYLIGNKADLERCREVKSKACKQLTKLYRCHFSEISTALNHKIDELLCKIIMDIVKLQSKIDSPRKSIQKRPESQLNKTLGKLFKKTFGT